VRASPFLVLAVVVLVLALVVVAQGADLALPGNHAGYEPDQPVAFSHALHARDLAIDCLYCHSGAERSRHAGIPSDAVCMNCHRFVAAPLAMVREEEARAKAADPAAPKPRAVVSPEIAKLYEAAGLDGQGKPVPGKEPTPLRWVRVHDLPDHAFFDHRPHVNAGVACATCHGPVDAMDRVRQHADLSMGWCVNCHRAANASGLPSGGPAAASTDCTTCHR
jgi:hypothetical protein